MEEAYNPVYDLAQYEDQNLDYLNSPSIFNQANRKDEGLGKWEIDFRKIVESKLMAYRGFYFDSKNKTYIKNPHAVPMLNERGICDMLNFFETHLNKAIPIGKLTREEIDTIMLRLRLSAGDLFYTNFVAYEIPNFAVWRALLHDITTLALVVLNRSEGGWEATNRIKQISISQSNAQQQITNAAAKKSFWNKIVGGSD